MLSKILRKIRPGFFPRVKCCNQFNSYIPPMSINYNWGGRKSDYNDAFANLYINYILPLALEQTKCDEILSGLRVPKILDIGCGFAPMALALKVLISSTEHLREGESLDLSGVGANEKNTDSIKYVGIDIRDDAVSFLKKAYVHDKEFYFHHHLASTTVDYIGDLKVLKKHNNANTLFSSDGNECLFSIPFPYEADIQWSSSLFTHLTPEGVQNTLSFISSNLIRGGVSINTWLIVDGHSSLAMMSGYADRQLPIVSDHFLTYSQTNPLVCTAYKLKYILKAYDKAGLKVLSIDRGSWRGCGIRNKFNHYQDVIVASKL